MGKLMFRCRGEDSEGGAEEGAEVGFWNIFLMSILGLGTEAAEGAAAGGVAAAVDDDDDDDVEAAGVITDDLEEMDAFPLTWPVAGTDPKDFTPSDLIGGAATGDEDIGAETSSIEPKVTAEPGNEEKGMRWDRK